MPNTNQLVQLMKQAAIEAVQASKPCDIVYGTVITSSPLSVKIDQKLTLTSEFLSVVESLTDHEVDIDITSWTTETSNLHTHELKGNNLKFKMLNGLKTNDNVVMLRMSGGQKYLIIDKVV